MPVFSGEDLTKSAKLLITGALVVADPSGLTAGAAGMDGLLTYFDLKTATHPDLKKLEKETAKKLKARFKTPNFHCPNGADIHLPQMIEAGLATPADFVDCNLDAEKVVEQMIAQLIEPEHRKAEMVEAYRGLCLPVLRGLMADPRMVAVLTPMIARKQLQQSDNIAAKLDHLATLPRDQLELLAGRFEIANAFDLSDVKIQEKLTLKARDFRAYRKLIDGIDDRVAGLGNLKAAAKDAAERLDFDEVEELMLRVDEVETSIAAEAKEIRAANALLRGRVRQAYDIYCAAADSFASVDPLEPSRRRQIYHKALHQHGQRFGGLGLNLALKMLNAASRSLAKNQDCKLWASIQNNIGTTLWIIGSRETANDTLLKAEAAYKKSLSVQFSVETELVCSQTKNNLGNVQSALGNRSKDSKYLLLAEATYNEVLEVQTPINAAKLWATTKNNLGGVLRILGQRNGDKDTLKRSIVVYQDALTFRTKESHPGAWAVTKQNIGIAFHALGELENNATLLQKAVTAYEDALEVRTRENIPFYWAMTQNNLGSVWLAIGRREDGLCSLNKALVAFENTLEEHTRETTTLGWAMSLNNLGEALCEVGAREDGTEKLILAKSAFENVLLERSLEDTPLSWATTQKSICKLELAYFDKDGDQARLDKASANLKLAKAVFKEANANRYLQLVDEQQNEIDRRRA